MAPSALQGIRVLDLGDYISAPYCACLFGDYGADVLKVEPPRGDSARRAGPFPDDVPHPEKSGLFLTINTNKSSVTLNLATPDGRAIFKELLQVQDFDLLVENFPPGYMESLGLGYEVLSALNPGLVMTSVTPFGCSGPYLDFQATDIVTFALTNRMAPHGTYGREPLNYAPEVVWFQAGGTAAAASIASVYQSRATGVGRFVEISAQEALSGNVDTRTVFQQYTGRPFTRGAVGAGYPAAAYPCRDGYILFAAGGERFFRRLCWVMGRQDILEDPRWATGTARLDHEDEFNEIFFPWLMERSKEEIFRVCQEAGVMCAPVNTVEDLFHDQQLGARGFFTPVDNWEAGRLYQPSAPFKMTETQWRVRAPAPTLGQDNGAVYRGWLGYTKRDLTLLRSMGVI